MKTKVESPSVSPDWTEQKDLEWCRNEFESEARDPYVAILERLWHERRNLEDSLTGWIGTFLAEEEFDPDPVAECLGALAKADLLLSIIQSHQAEAASGCFEKDLARIKSAVELCERVAARYLLQRKKVWLFEIGTAVQELARSGWQLKDSIRGNYVYQRRPRVQQNQP